MKITGERSICWLPGRCRQRRSEVLPRDSSDDAVPQFADVHQCVLLTCNRDDFLHLAMARPHHGIVIVIRRRTRADERAALFSLLERAGETGLRNNVNFA
jgi:hypothetical protein